MIKEWKVEAFDLANSLALDFGDGPIVDDEGRRSLIEGLVATINGLKIEIFSNDHPPPHFRVFYAGENADFSIKDGRKLKGGLKKWERNIRSWHASHKSDLINFWNKTRPSDCPVGEYFE
jgi:hypothetical protein